MGVEKTEEEDMSEENEMKITVIDNTTSYQIARIIIDGPWSRDTSQAKKVIEAVYQKWPKNKKTKYLVTCSGFLEFAWPEIPVNIGNNWHPDISVIESLKGAALEKCRVFFDDAIRKKLLEVTDYIIMGIDSEKFSKMNHEKWPKHPHIEFVFILDLMKMQYHWTGKSYPEGEQVHGLIRIADFNSHFSQINDEKLLLLECYDLMLESPRGKAATSPNGERHKIRSEFELLLAKEKPSTVIHLSHTTDTFSSWSKAYNELIRIAPFITTYVNCGVFFRKNGNRSSREEVLLDSRNVKTLDFIFEIRGDKTFPQAIPVTARKMNAEDTSRIKVDDKASFIDAFREKNSAESIKTAERIIEWARSQNLQMYWSKAGTFYPMFEYTGKKGNNLFSLKLTGIIEIQGKFLIKKKPFDEIEKQRMFQKRLENCDLGISEQIISGLPRFELLKLNEGNKLESFLKTMEWCLDEIHTRIHG